MKCLPCIIKPLTKKECKIAKKFFDEELSKEGGKDIPMLWSYEMYQIYKDEYYANAVRNILIRENLLEGNENE